MKKGRYGRIEYTLTKRNNKIVSRKVYKYSWSIEANLKRNTYHETKNGKIYPLLPIHHEKKSKEELLASRRFSQYHYTLINNAYCKESQSLRILKCITNEQKHNIELENTAKKLSIYKSALKLKNPKNSMYKVIIHSVDDKHNVDILDTKYVKDIPTVDYLANLNRNLSKYIWYHHLTVVDSLNNIRTLFVCCDRY